MIELEACAHVVPLMAPETVVEVARQAERIGYHHCLVADEGFHPDVHTCLGMIARETTRMRLGFSANPYTRHPAVTAAAAATLDRLSGGRAFVTLLTGGSMVLGPMGLERHRPRATLDDALQVMRLLWSGDEVTHRGAVFSLDRARLAVAPCQPPVWVAGRGPGVLGVAGRHADLALCTVKPDLAGAFAVVDEAARGRPAPPRRAYLGRICFTEEMVEDQAATLPFVLLDSPRRVLEAIGFDDEEIALIERAAADNRPDLVDSLIGPDLLRRYQVVGTPTECAAELADLAVRHRLDVVLTDVLLDDLSANVAVMEQVFAIITEANRLLRDRVSTPPDPGAP